MDRLAVYLRAFIHAKITNDAGWRNIKVRTLAGPFAIRPTHPADL